MLGGGLVARWGWWCSLPRFLLLGGLMLDPRSPHGNARAAGPRAMRARSPAVGSPRAQARLRECALRRGDKGGAVMRDQATARIERIRNLQLEGCADAPIDPESFPPVS